ncbi:MAG: tryptophan synthase subunit alpha, partial [Nostoc sp.]
DAVIVGSAFVKRLAQDSPEEGLSAIAEFCQSLKAAIKTTNTSINTPLDETRKVD